MSAEPHDISRARISVRLEVIPADLLDVDPDVQHDFALSEKAWREIGRTWDTRKQGVLEITPQPKGSPRFWVIDGRHRMLGGREIAGVKEFRCNVHRPTLNKQEKAALKLGLDRDRRRVSALESFLVEVTAGDLTAIAIKKEVERAGYKIAMTSGRRHASAGNNIAAIGALRTIHKDGLLSRVLALNTLWLDEPRTNTSDWLLGLLVFVRNDYDQRLTEAQYSRLKETIPGMVWKKAMGKQTTSWGRSVGGDVREVSRLIGEELRRAAGVRKSPGK